VRAVLDAHAHRRARDVLAALLSAVREWAEPPLDDLTVLVLKQLADPQPSETRVLRPATARPARAAAMTVLKSRAAGADTPR
jgi:hypothetical protein